MHGTEGSISFDAEYFEKELKMPVTTPLQLPNVRLKNDNGVVTVTLKNWSKYQARSESYDRVMRYREKQKDTLPVTVTETLQEKGVTVDKIRRDKNRKEEEKEKNKDIYGEFKNVLLTEDEHKKLVIQFCDFGVKERIENLSAYIASKGKKYSSHYATILNWERKNDGTNPGNSRGPYRESKGKSTKYAHLTTTFGGESAEEKNK